MKTFFACLLLFFFTGSYAQYDFESCHALWELTAKLKNNIRPDSIEWEALHQTEGYKRKTISKERWKDFTNKITFAFTPGNKDSLAAISKTDLTYKYIAEYVWLEDSLKQYARNIDQLSIIDSATSYVQQRLPNEFKKCFQPPVIYFALWDYDGSATANYVCVDLLLSWHMSKFKPGIFEAHELYHSAVTSCGIKTRHIKRNPSEEHTGVYTLVNSVSTEGTADLIDKEWLVFNPQSPYLHKDTFNAFSNRHGPVLIQKINEGLEKMAEKKRKPYNETAYWLQLMPWAAHIPGTYMSQVIKRNGLEKETFEQTGNSFQFFYLYNRAAAMDASTPPVFSEKAIKFLKALEQRYIR